MSSPALPESATGCDFVQISCSLNSCYYLFYIASASKDFFSFSAHMAFFHAQFRFVFAFFIFEYAVIFKNDVAADDTAPSLFHVS